MNLHNDRYLRLRQVLAPDGILPISRSTWYAGIREGRYPAPIKLSPRISVWKASDLDRLIQSLLEGAV